MSNGVRHVLGVLAGLILAPVVAAALLYAGFLFNEANRVFSMPWAAYGVMAVAGILVAVLAGSRLSPIASLICGVAFIAFGLTWPLKIIDLSGLLPRVLAIGSMMMLSIGVFLILGVILVAASMFPSRWTRRTPAPVPPFGGPGFGGPPPAFEAPRPPFQPPEQQPQQRVESPPTLQMPDEAAGSAPTMEAPVPSDSADTQTDAGPTRRLPRERPPFS